MQKASSTGVDQLGVKIFFSGSPIAAAGGGHNMLAWVL